MKWFGINVQKYMKNPDPGNNKTLLREMKADLNKWRNHPWSWTGRLSIINMSDTMHLSADTIS